MQNARLRTLAAASIFVGLALAGASARAAIFTVTTTADSGPGSLRQAILDANASPGSDGISFAIPGSGVHTIAVIDPLPAIAESVLIDGYSQPGSSWNADPLADDAVLQIELVGDGTDGLTLTGGSSIVQGLALYGFQTAIAITQVENSIIQGCFIGTDAAGNSTFGNNRGVVITSPFGADKVGDAYPAARNLISGNAIGVEIVGTGGKSVINNLIGTDRTGTARQWNGTGVQITASSFCTVGGNPPSRNIISGNLGDGVSMTDGNTNAVRYNFIGTDPTGTKAVANGGDGIRTAGTEQNYLIDRNVVSGNTGNGITLGETSFPDGTREAVDWNKIGTADDGFSPIGNGGDGIRVSTQDDMGIHDNIVAFNHAGIRVPAPSIYNACEIVDAWMFGNHAGLGIVNGSGDAIGANLPGGAFNFPIITSASPDPGGTRVQGYLSGHPSVPVTIEVYSVPVCSVVRPRDWIEGRISIGALSGVTDASGFFAIDTVFPVTLNGETVVATSTITQTSPLNGFFGPTKHTSSYSQRLPFALTPSSGSAAGGTSVVISGTNFDPAATVTFAGQPAASAVVDSHLQITATTPALSPGIAYDVEVTNPGAPSSSLPAGWVTDFLDVPPSSPVHDYVVALLASRISGGVGGGNYGVAQPVLRQQMAVFLLKAKHGVCYIPLPCSGVFGDVPCPSAFADWVEALAAEGITGGCGGGNFCPTNPVRRDQMAAFLLKAEHGSTYVPGPCSGAFADVPCPSLFADWIEQLADEGVTAGCGGANYCPAASNTRGQMAVFLTKTFQLQ